MATRKRESVESWRMIMIIGAAIIVLLAGTLAYVVIIDHNNRVEAELKARVESCKNFNRTQTGNRKHDHDFIVKLVELRGGGDAVAALETDPRLAELDQFSAEFYNYRQCSPQCVNALLDSKIPDCPPASNEEGDP